MSCPETLLPPYLYQDAGGALHFDVPLFLRAHGYADTPENRDLIAEAAREAFGKRYPGLPISVTTANE